MDPDRLLIVLVIMLHGIWSSISVGGSDPCLEINHGFLRDLNGIRASGATPPGSHDLCDSVVNEGWYRVFSPAGGDMPTQCVELNNCHTAHPVWLQGNIPKDDKIHNMTARITQTTCDKATKPQQIRVKNCGNYTVYYLTALPQCPAAYCFGSKLCPPGKNSANGRSPGCSSNFFDFTDRPSVTVSPGFIPGSSARQEVQFMCGLPSSHNVPTNLNAEVRWYVGEGHRRLGPFGVSVKYLPHILHESDWSHLNISLGINFWCDMRIIGGNYAVPSIWKTSTKYFAGITVNGNLPNSKTPVTVTRGQSKQLFLQPTIPIICGDKACSLNVHVHIPQRYKTSTCQQSPGKLPFASLFSSTFCGQMIPGYKLNDDWKEFLNTATNFTVYGKAKYELESASHSFNLILAATADFKPHPVWNNFILNTTILVVDPTANFKASTSCWSDGDPRITTFDQCYQKEGEFIMFLHDTLPIQVNVYTQDCPPTPSGACICGVAVKSGSEVFIMDQCRARGRSSDTRPIRLGFLECSQKSMDIVEKSPSSYRISLPTGTVVEIKHYFGIRVEIFPSFEDLQHVNGLCGNFDGNINNDLRHRTTDPSKPVIIIPTSCRNLNESLLNDFLESWRIGQGNRDQSLYNRNNVGSVSKPMIFYCRCTANCPMFSCPPTAKAECEFDQFIDTCVKAGIDRNSHFRQQCFHRSKRSVHNLAGDVSDMDAPPFAYDENYKPTQPVWQNGWNEIKARTTCSSSIYSTATGSKCLQLNPDQQKAIQICVDDIMITGDKAYVGAGINTMIGACEAEIYRNVSLWKSPDPGKPPAPPVEFTNVLCPNLCNNRGSCDQGVCTCSSGFAGTDCSVDLTKAANLVGAARQGVCDTESRLCEVVPLYGSNFLDSSLLACRVRKIKIFSDNGTESEVATSYPGTYQHSMEVFCPLPRLKESRKKRTVNSRYLLGNIYYISVSNKGKLFSSEIPVIVAPKSCISCDIQSQTCHIKGNTCYIDSACRMDGQTDPYNSCQHCDPTRNMLHWSYSNDCATSTHRPITKSTDASLTTQTQTSSADALVSVPIYLIVVIVAVLVILILVILLLLCAVRKSNIRGCKTTCITTDDVAASDVPPVSRTVEQSVAPPTYADSQRDSGNPHPSGRFNGHDNGGYTDGTSTRVNGDDDDDDDGYLVALSHGYTNQRNGIYIHGKATSALNNSSNTDAASATVTVHGQWFNAGNGNGIPSVCEGPQSQCSSVYHLYEDVM